MAAAAVPGAAWAAPVRGDWGFPVPFDQMGRKLDEWTRERVDLGLLRSQHRVVQSFSHYWKRLPFWRATVAMWFGFSILFFALVSLHLDVLSALAISVFQLLLCLALTAGLQRAYRRLRKFVHFGIETAGWIIGLSLAATLVQSAAAHFFIIYTGWKDPSWSLLELWLMRMMFFWLVYMLWSLFYFWLRAERASQANVLRAAESRADAQRMELQLLRSQLDPHFLFNALNGIATVVQPDSPTGSTMVRELADYLRYSLDHRFDTLVPLSEEIEAMMNYLRIEQTRFAEELEVEITTDEIARSGNVPCFLLLPLVENAVKHSFQECDPPWNVVIVAESKEGGLFIDVANTGSLATNTADAHGVGLEILRRRLALHYPDRHELSLSECDGMVHATLKLEGEPCSA